MAGGREGYLRTVAGRSLVGLCACEGGVGVKLLSGQGSGLLSGICENFQWWLLGCSELSWTGLAWAGLRFCRAVCCLYLCERVVVVVVVVVVVMSVVLVVVGRGCLHVWGSVGERGGVYIYVRPTTVPYVCHFVFGFKSVRNQINSN